MMYGCEALRSRGEWVTTQLLRAGALKRLVGLEHCDTYTSGLRGLYVPPRHPLDSTLSQSLLHALDANVVALGQLPFWCAGQESSNEPHNTCGPQPFANPGSW